MSGSGSLPARTNHRGGAPMPGPDGDQVLATLHPRPEFQSYPGVLHGGLSATALDEVMGYAAILLAGIWAATATMDLRYRAQVPYDAPLPLVAGLTDTRGRRVRTW